MKIYELYKAYAESLFKRIKEGTPYTETLCKQCPYEHRCCDYTVSLTIFETVAILQYVTDNFVNPVKFMERVKERAAETDQHYRGFSSLRAGSREWAKKKKRCIFYNHLNKQCMIYEVRPFNCRTFYSVQDCYQDKGMSIREREELTQKRETYITSEHPYFKNNDMYELTESLTALNDTQEYEISNELETIMNNFSEDK